MTVKEIVSLIGCQDSSVYRYYRRHKTLDGFLERSNRKSKRVMFNGQMLTFSEIANCLGISQGSARRAYSRHGNFDVCGKRHKGMPVPHLEEYYHTLDKTIPLDRCISLAGYRSIRQFCHDNELSESQVGRWRNGKIDHARTRLLVDEMINRQYGISIPLKRMMQSTGCLEWEMFPQVFTPDYYNYIHKNYRVNACAESYNDDTVERKECRRIVNSVISTLPKRLRTVVELTFGLGKDHEELTYEQIGHRFGVTRECVRHLLNSALRRLMKPSCLRLLSAVTQQRCRFDRSVRDALQELQKMKKHHNG